VFSGRKSQINYVDFQIVGTITPDYKTRGKLSLYQTDLSRPWSWTFDSLTPKNNPRSERLRTSL